MGRVDKKYGLSRNGQKFKQNAMKIISYNIHHYSAHLQSSVFKLSKDLIDSIHEEGIVAYTS